MQAIVAPLSANALPASAELCSGSLADGLDAAGGEEIPHPGRARRVRGEIAEAGEEHLRALAGPRRDAHRRHRAAARTARPAGAAAAARPRCRP